MDPSSFVTTFMIVVLLYTFFTYTLSPSSLQPEVARAAIAARISPRIAFSLNCGLKLLLQEFFLIPLGDSAGDSALEVRPRPLEQRLADLRAALLLDVRANRGDHLPNVLR